MAIDSHINTRKIESTPWSINNQLDEQKLQRLADISEDNRVSAQVGLVFQRETKNEVRATGQITAKLALVCQRCLQIYNCEIAVELNEVFTEQNKDLEHHYKDDQGTAVESEPSDYFDQQGLFSLLHYVEDEILLAVPTFPAHPDSADCDTEMIRRLEDKNTVEAERENPFAVLKNLK